MSCPRQVNAQWSSLMNTEAGNNSWGFVGIWCKGGGNRPICPNMTPQHHSDWGTKPTRVFDKFGRTKEASSLSGNFAGYSRKPNCRSVEKDHFSGSIPYSSDGKTVSRGSTQGGAQRGKPKGGKHCENLGVSHNVPNPAINSNKEGGGSHISGGEHSKMGVTNSQRG